MTSNWPTSAGLTSAYVPADRRQSLAHNLPLPEYGRGSALFADISGFTLLTESLKRGQGPRQGAELLAQHLNQVYDALIAEVDRYGGSVIGFSGDAVTCWFDETFISRIYQQQGLPLPDGESSRAALRAVTCARAMIAAMQQFAAVEVPNQGVFPLRVKVAVASGEAHRWRVGDPQYQSIDVTAGATIQRMATAEGLAGRDEVVIDQPTASLLEESLLLGEPRYAPDGLECFFVVEGLRASANPLPWPTLPPEALSDPQADSYVLPPIYERLRQGQGEFLTELRPAVALFLRFGGIDYETDPHAGPRLDAFIRWVQGVVRRYDGAFIQLTIGEKGSYLFVAFGAPRAHEDDPWRAVHAALELRHPPAELASINQLQIGIASGVMRTGAYGSKTRRTYGVLGDEVNLSARLMQLAQPDGQILITGPVQEALGEVAICRSLPPLQVKGKNQLTPVADLVGVASWRPSMITYQGPLIGREAELEQLLRALAPLLETPARSAGLVVLDGEAGIGKSRLAHELHLRLDAAGAGSAVQPRLRWLECPTDPVLGQSLYPFRHLLHRYFVQDAGLPVEENFRRFDATLDQLMQWLETHSSSMDVAQPPELSRQLQRTRSMLGALLGLHWPGSLYELLEPKQRFENTLAGLRALLLAESLRQPLLLHIEDAHRLDPDSLAALKLLLHNTGPYPLLVLLSGRYSDQDGQGRQPLENDGLPPGLYLPIRELTLPEISQAAAAILNRSTASTWMVSDELNAFLREKTSGNPLFLEELILELCEREILQVENQRWTLKQQHVLEAPAGLNALLISRLDRLEGEIKSGVQTAAVIGREFAAPVLQAMLPSSKQADQVIEQALAQQIWLSSGAARYSFRQSLLRDAAYSMQPHNRLQLLHTQAAEAILQVHAGALEAHYADLAYHYHQAQNDRQALYYARQAGEIAAAQYANPQAIQLLELALECAGRLPDAEVQSERLLAQLTLGQTLVMTGQHQPAGDHLRQAVALAAQIKEPDSEARACRWLARLHENRGEYPQALEWIERGLQILAERETAEASELLNHAGLILSRQGSYPAAQEKALRCLEIAEQSGKPAARARAYNLLGHIARLRGESNIAIEHFTTALHLYQQARDINGQALVQNQLANALFGVGRWQEAEQHYTLAQATFEQTGDLYNRIFVENNLGWIALNQGRLDQALGYYHSGLAGLEQIGGSPYVLGAFHNNLGAAYIRLGDLPAARRHLAASQALFEQAGARDWLAELHRHKATAAMLAGELSEAEHQAETALALARELNMRAEEGNALRVLGEIAAAHGQVRAAHQYLVHSLEILKAVGDEFESARSLLALARLNTEEPQKIAAALAQVIPVLERLGASRELAEAQARLDQTITQ